MKNTCRSPSDVDKIIGQRIRDARMRNDMTLEKLGEALGITFQQIQKYERGVNRISAGRLLEVATVLDMRVTNFFHGLQPKGASK